MSSANSVTSASTTLVRSPSLLCTARCRSYGGAAFEDLGGDRELLGTSEPPCYRLQVTKKLIDLVPQRGGRAGIGW